jgi:SpoVK/Ycf46/Vps4 family AAA+-type ATPase
VSEDPFLVADNENQQMGQHTTKKHLHHEDKVLITCRVFAYVFRERKFAQLDVQRLKPSAQSRDALDSLRIPEETKDLIQGSVRGHFIQKEFEKRNGEEGLSLDVIQGKGTGLFILLHGVPGVGKTATAEAVAQANGKPLFKITVGDLGLTPDQVESSLRHIFRLASNWDCILLMDEVDTFFSQRSKGDAAMTKNALVSGEYRWLRNDATS